MKCNRCAKPLIPGHEENCWYCGGALCFQCWETVGHCGHRQAEKINRAVTAFNDVIAKGGSKDEANAVYRQVVAGN